MLRVRVSVERNFALHDDHIRDGAGETLLDDVRGGRHAGEVGAGEEADTVFTTFARCDDDDGNTSAIILLNTDTGKIDAASLEGRLEDTIEV